MNFILKIYLPPDLWTLLRTEEKEIQQDIMRLIRPDDHCSNIGKCMSQYQCKVIRLKSHGYHLLMQQLLQVVLRGLLLKWPQIPYIC